MHFISAEFLAFAVAFFLLFFFLGRRGQKVLLLAAGYFFCGFHSGLFAGILALSTSGNYLFSRLITSEKYPKRAMMWCGIAFNLVILGIFKYFDFFSNSMSSAAASVGVHYSATILHLVVPIGLSFYTFQAISYIVDLRNEKIDRASFIDLAVFLSFWPKFVAGPIIRATAFMPQLQVRRTFKWANFYLGAESIIYGLFLKAVLSDYLAPQVKKVYEAPQAYDGASSLIAAFFFTFQIYGDFAGYSLIVIGMARIAGYSIRANFKRPNFAVSFSDFWSRWHISLSTWLDEYVFRNLVPKKSPDSALDWSSVSHIFSEILESEAVSSSDSFASLSGDSLSYVQIALAIESYLGSLPKGWETMSVAHLESLRATA